MAIKSLIRVPLAAGETKIEYWEEAGLIKPSVFKPVIATISKEQIIKIPGNITSADQLKLTNTIKNLASLPCFTRHLLWFQWLNLKKSRFPDKEAAL